MTRNTTPKLKDYPPHDGYEGGCKIARYYYRDRKDADEAVKAARYNGQIMAGWGYDFGYMAPGALTRIATGERAGMYEVIIP